MSIVVNLMSAKKGELRRFLDSYFNEATNTEDDVAEWIYVYNRASDALNLIDVYADNKGSYDISLWVQIGEDDIISVSEHNYNEIVGQIHAI